MSNATPPILLRERMSGLCTRTGLTPIYSRRTESESEREREKESPLQLNVEVTDIRSHWKSAVAAGRHKFRCINYHRITDNLMRELTRRVADKRNNIHACNICCSFIVYPINRCSLSLSLSDARARACELPTHR